jgi:protein involved in polysaccharide export with SLBB domain
MVAKNIVTGLHPLAIRISVPSSTTPIGPGDWIAVECPDRPEYSQRVRVLSDETISLKGIGTIDVAGQDIAKVEASLKAHYRKMFKTSAFQSLQVFRGDSFQGQP